MNREDVSAPTATRAAELAEIAALRTQVVDLQTQVAVLQTRATAPPTRSPPQTPTLVTPAATGQDLPYTGAWTIIVERASVRGALGNQTPSGRFIQVDLTVANVRGAARVLNFRDFRLMDERGRTYDLAPLATTTISSVWQYPISPASPAAISLVFDVAQDAGQTFILESSADPTFRVRITLGGLG